MDIGKLASALVAGWRGLRHPSPSALAHVISDNFAGMLVIDREKFGAADLPGETRRMHESGLLARIQYDQAVLNLVFKDKWLPLDFRWNLICPWPAHEALEPLLLHYTGHRKPWNLVSGVAFSNAYRHTMTNAVFYKFWRERLKRRLLAPFKKLMGR